MKWILFLVLPVFLFYGCTNNQYEISGFVKGADGEVLFLERMDLDGNQIIDSIHIDSRGEFGFSGDRLDYPTFFRLSLQKGNYLTVLLDSTEKISLQLDAGNLAIHSQIENSKGSNQIQELNVQIMELNSKLNRLEKEYALQKKQSGETLPIENEYKASLEKYRKYIGDFVMANPRSFASYYALFQTFSDGAVVMDVFDAKDQVYFSALATSLNLVYPNSPRTKHLYNYVLGAKKKSVKDDRLTHLLEQGSAINYPDLEVENDKGEKVKLSSLHGKHILVSFWASWDEKSRSENKTLKKVFSTYHQKGFEIYQVSLDKSEILWKDAIKNDNLNWINVSDLRYLESYPAKKYNVSHLPANFLISPEGEIIGKNLFGQRLEERLNELF